MTYYMLPKTNNNIILKIYDNSVTENSLNNVYVSHSLFNYCNASYTQIEKLHEKNIDFNFFEKLSKFVNPYEYIHSKVPGFKYAVSKLNSKSNMLYEFLEIINTFNIFDDYKIRNINALHVGNNCKDTKECIEMIREQFNEDSHIMFTNSSECLNYITSITIQINNYDLFFYDACDSNINKFIVKITQLLFILLKCQNKNGSAIIKINNTFLKQTTDLLYFLSSIYEKVYIIKPNASNILNEEKYIICKGFILNDNKFETYCLSCDNLQKYLLNLKTDNNLFSFLDYKIPYYFINKLEDINVILGQQQLETYDQLFNLINNKNCEEKIELIKKTHIQKATSWCEKYKIPFNKFSDKLNIFLPINKDPTIDLVNSVIINNK